MAQTTILAAAQTTATSTDVVVPAGAVVTIGLFAAGAVPPQARAAVYIDTPSGDQFVKFLQGGQPEVISGPGTFRAVRKASISRYGVDVGIYIED